MQDPTKLKFDQIMNVIIAYLADARTLLKTYHHTANVKCSINDTIKCWCTILIMVSVFSMSLLTR